MQTDFAESIVIEWLRERMAGIQRPQRFIRMQLADKPAHVDISQMQPNHAAFWTRWAGQPIWIVSGLMSGDLRRCGGRVFQVAPEHPIIADVAASCGVTCYEGNLYICEHQFMAIGD